MSGENECMGAGLCASVLAVNVIVFWLGLSGAPSSGLVEILAALTSPSLSQFDSWWDLRWNVRVWIASNIHNNLISLLHPSPLFPSLSLSFHSSTSSLFICSHCSLSLFFYSVSPYTFHTPLIQFTGFRSSAKPCLLGYSFSSWWFHAVSVPQVPWSKVIQG